MNFDTWIAKVVENLANKHKKDLTEIYSSINLSDAKLSYLDGLDPMEYILSN